MKPYVRLAWAAGATAVVLLVVFLCLRKAADRLQRQSASASPTALLNAPADTLPPEEVFRRAFWRQPSAGDRILHAERRETPAETGGAVARWQWFIAIIPGPELLRGLRDPGTFGLLPVKPGAPLRHWPVDPRPAPDWFPKVETAFDFEVLQNPGSGLTVLYNPKKNILFATDHGSGFAAPAR